MWILASGCRPGESRTFLKPQFLKMMLVNSTVEIAISYFILTTLETKKKIIFFASG